LDNCEQVLDDVSDVVDAVLSVGLAPKVLITSRESLGAVGETVIRVPSLAVDPTDGEMSDAILLLVDRARLSPGDERVTGGHLEVLGDICRRLDGIPLAIELAAA
jgi:predicted ATPase